MLEDKLGKHLEDREQPIIDVNIISRVLANVQGIEQ